MRNSRNLCNWGFFLGDCLGAVSLFFGIAQGISRLRTRPEGMKTNEVCGCPLDCFGCTLLVVDFYWKFLFWLPFYRLIMQRRREQRIKSRLVLKSNMGEMLRKAHQSHSKSPRNTAWQRVQRIVTQTQVNASSGFANAASSSASGYSKVNRS